jgi:protein-L-isoaspartate(D-aspartate) O-methyltransferase
MPEHQQNWADIAGTDAASIAGAETAVFLMSLRAKGIRDTALLRVMEGVPRSLFAPARCADLARADVSLPLACGQTMLAPSVVATLLAALACKPGQRVLEIGTGSGYITALLAQLAAEVVSVERYRGLAVAAAERLGALGATNVTVIHRDGLALSRELGGFDRILLTGSVTALPEGLFSALQPAGVLVAVVPVNGLPRVVVVSRTQTGAFQETHGAVMRLPPLAPGIGGVL